MTQSKPDALTPPKDTGASLGKAAIRDWTQGSITGNLWSLSWPLIINQSLNMLGPTIDMVWVGKLGSAAVAGVGLAGMAVQLANSLFMGVYAGVRALIARFIGAGDSERANAAAKQAFVVSAVLSVIMAAIGIFFAEPILKAFGVEAEVVAEGAPYLRISFIGMVTMSFVQMTSSIMQASGDTVNPMVMAVIYRTFHIAVCPFLVFGLWIFPKLGVNGAALTAVMSQALGLTIGLWFLVSGRSRLKLNFRGFRFDRELTWRIVRIGLPAAITGAERSLVNLVMMLFISPFGTFAVAAHTIQQRVEMILIMPGFGFGQASGVLAGQNLGAHRPERAEKSGWMGSFLVAAFMIISSTGLWFSAPWVVRIFNSETGVVEMASSFIRIATAGYLFIGFAAVLSECLNGVGDTIVPMTASLITMYGVQVPLAIFLPRWTGLGVLGVRWAMVAALALRTTAYIIYFKAGRWKRKVV
jgi:putative MATE family efflux protein